MKPDWPCSAFYKTDSFMLAHKIFTALDSDGFRADHIRCLQRKPTGKVFLTFPTQAFRDAFLQRSSFVVSTRPGRRFVPNNAERCLTFLTVYGAPYELPDPAIIHQLSPYCEVAWHCHRTYRSGKTGGIFNGLRHYRVQVHHSIPSYLWFGKFLVRLYHVGQVPTCRKCNRPDHKAAECRNIICFNCDGLGNTARQCIKPMYCCICKSGQHLVRDCPHSWRCTVEHVDLDGAQDDIAEGTGAGEGDHEDAGGVNIDGDPAVYDPPVHFGPDDPWPGENSAECLDASAEAMNVDTLTPVKNTATPVEDTAAPVSVPDSPGAAGYPVEVIDPPNPVVCAPVVPDSPSPAGGHPVEVIDSPNPVLCAPVVPDSPGPAGADLVLNLTGGSVTPRDQTQISHPVLVIDSQGFLQLSPEPVGLLPCANVALSSTDGSAPTSWADIVDHVGVPSDPSTAMASAIPVRRSGIRPPLPPHAGRVAQRRPEEIASLANIKVPARKLTQPSRVSAPPSQKSAAAARSTPLPKDSEVVMETEESLGKRKDPLLSL